MFKLGASPIHYFCLAASLGVCQETTLIGWTALERQNSLLHLQMFCQKVSRTLLVSVSWQRHSVLWVKTDLKRVYLNSFVHQRQEHITHSRNLTLVFHQGEYFVVSSTSDKLYVFMAHNTSPPLSLRMQLWHSPQTVKKCSFSQNTTPPNKTYTISGQSSSDGSKSAPKSSMLRPTELSKHICKEQSAVFTSFTKNARKK